MTTADRIREARRRKRMSQEHLAKVAGVSVRTVRRVETGKDISAENLRCVCAVLEIASEDEAPEQAPAMAAPPVASHPHRLVMPSASVPASPFLMTAEPGAPAPRFPASRGYLADLLGGMTHAGGLFTLIFCGMFHGLFGLIQGGLCLVAGQFTIGAFLVVQAAFAMVLMFGAFEGPETQGLAFYRFRSWVSVALAPANVLAWGLNAHCYPQASGLAGPLLSALAWIGVPFLVIGVVNLVRLERDLRDPRPMPA